MSATVCCMACGKEIDCAAATCPACSTPQKAAGGGKNKIVAALLAFFLGAFGVHRFYLGKWWGTFYLLFFWTLIPNVVGVVESIVFLATGNEAWDAKYNGGVPSAGRSNPAIAIAIAVCGCCCAAFVGILAMTVIPAYADYAARTKLAEVELDSERVTAAFDNYLQKNMAVPENVKMLGVPLSNKHIRSIEIDHQKGVISLTLADIAQADGKHLLLIPHENTDGNITWTCVSEDIRAILLPQRCRQR